MKELERLTELLQKQREYFEQNYPKNPCKHKSTEALVLAYGIPFTKQAKLKFQGEVNACYQNCYQLLGPNKNLHYCEGYATSKNLDMALPHAWLVDETGAVVEPTWTNLELEEVAYFGVVLTRSFLRQMALKTKVYGVLEEDYRFGHLLKKEGFPPGALHPLFHKNHA
ncbi:hypothetical protein NG796_24605 [Laspinema sp. A4]|uniref:hypothetical protein n=1 Tax=Laspinema sp. D2d TaxID=2953686 RepID=UPI0021BA8A61|nr:hypothetical protein [Laspinema sp. D2d]MCT7986457.1 hypothetical protein [Laspinema sp. D2d]